MAFSYELKRQGKVKERMLENDMRTMKKKVCGWVQVPARAMFVCSLLPPPVVVIVGCVYNKLQLRPLFFYRRVFREKIILIFADEVPREEESNRFRSDSDSLLHRESRLDLDIKSSL